MGVDHAQGFSIGRPQPAALMLGVHPPSQRSGADLCVRPGRAL
jgi:EAL domain-containing protein (putative c-di-GMP-specific phosphodiesterase class I)